MYVCAAQYLFHCHTGCTETSVWSATDATARRTLTKTELVCPARVRLDSHQEAVGGRTLRHLIGSLDGLGPPQVQGAGEVDGIRVRVGVLHEDGDGHGEAAMIVGCKTTRLWQEKFLKSNNSQSNTGVSWAKREKIMWD